MGDRQINNAFRDNNNHPGRMTGRPTKKFISYDTLRFEKERLETFINWPVVWMKPEDLAKDGFHYLRTKDHCACVFCGGIVGAWEQGDIAREEHKRHFPRCPFIQGHPVGNIPLAHGNIILGITPSPYTTFVLPPPSTDVCGHTSGSHPECRPPKKADSTYSGLGLPPHTGPKRKDFLSPESRAKSFTGWPDGVEQTPKQLAEAGFSYCGLSDHVRCFYCGNGLRNWEREDDPWEEHAKWYPECNFVLVKKGQEFIDRVRREKPPYLRSKPSEASPSLEKELDPLMELDIIKTTLGMGFPADKVRPALRRKLELTGLPFFSLEACIEAVLQHTEEESRLTLGESSARILECEAQQGALQESQTSSIPTSTGDEVSSSLSSSAGSSQHSPTSSSSTEEPTESLRITPTQEVLSLADQVTGTAEQETPDADPTCSFSPTLSSSAESTSMAGKLLPSSGESAVGKPQDLVVVEELDLKDTSMCKVCMDAELDTVFLPCTHMVTCSSCALALTQCPICREDIKYAIKPILS